MHQRKQPMSRILLLTALLLAGACSFTGLQAQKLQHRMAKRYNEVLDYPKVAAIYEKMEASGKADASTLRSLALTYRKMGQPQKAEAVYTRLLAMGDAKPDDMLAYADQLRANGK